VQRRARQALAPVTDLPVFDRRVLVVGATVFLLLMALSGLYGFHRDELYFLDSARHLSASYVDQPILTPLLARVSLSVFGVSLPGVRLWASLAAGATVVLGGLMARELAGGRRAQLLAALGVALSPALLGADHFFGPTALDILAWSAFAFVVVRIGRTGNTRLWAVAGGILGLGLANKHSIGFLALALVVATIATGGWRLLANRWFAAGALIAALCTAPDLWWQAGHGWATIAMTRRLNQENRGLANALVFVPSQLIMATPVLVWVWLAGLRGLWRSVPMLWRALALSYGILFILFAATAGAKPYYLAGAYPYLLAAGAVAVEPALARIQERVTPLTMSMAVSAVVTLPLVVPVLPPEAVGFVYPINQVPAETVGWPELVGTVSAAWRSLPASQQSSAVIFTADYGEAGAINQMGAQLGLPGAVSGHNSEWWWGPGNPAATTILAIAPGPKVFTGYDTYLRRFFGSVRAVATLSNHAHLANLEAGGHIYICTNPKRPWGQMWGQLRHYD
jgi:4-amino-4-deoxy-L-arabinose transferase-like glycosyltransferase